MKIILGVDDSPCSTAAVRFVGHLHWPADTQVIVLSVARTPVIVSTEMYAPGLSYDDRMMEKEIEYHREVAQRAEQELASTGLLTEVRVVPGDPRIEIVEVARNEKADLVVLGSHGRTGLAKLLIGSVASYVTTHAPCSVLVVKEGGRAS